MSAEAVPCLDLGRSFPGVAQFHAGRRAWLRLFAKLRVASINNNVDG